MVNPYHIGQVLFEIQQIIMDTGWMLQDISAISTGIYKLKFHMPKANQPVTVTMDFIAAGIRIYQPGNPTRLVHWDDTIK